MGVKFERSLCYKKLLGEEMNQLSLQTFFRFRLQRALVKRHLTGAFQSSVMQVHWKPSEDVACILCGVSQPGLLHDHLTCPKLEIVRTRWHEWLTQLTASEKPYLAFPVAPQLAEELELRLARQHSLLDPAEVQDR